MVRDYILIKLMGIMHQCPAGERTSGCHVLKLNEKFSRRLAFNYLRTLSDPELQEFYDAHCKCYNSRTESVFFHHKYILN
jgi:hypothetical protein